MQFVDKGQIYSRLTKISNSLCLKDLGLVDGIARHSFRATYIYQIVGRGTLMSGYLKQNCLC